MTARTDRIDQLIREELGEILARDVQDPRIGFTTVTSVETSPDLSHARVWVSVIGQPAERDAALQGLRRAMPFVRRELARRLTLRRVPELHVRLDDTAERGTRVLRLLSELETGAIPDESAAPESLPTPVGRVAREGDAETDPGAVAPRADEPVRPPRRRRREPRR
ncbi:MAG TPA: 30S ribosome-binding factor RbfA [Candidatus Deferrimicrobiaceae bacterium]|nr:30S ribosome-binding factor RbfA [Candidatus Deferrimicrobiaceae bacterium]